MRRPAARAMKACPVGVFGIFSGSCESKFAPSCDGKLIASAFKVL